MDGDAAAREDRCRVSGIWSAAEGAAPRCRCQPVTKIVCALIFHENYLLTETEKDALMLAPFLNDQRDLDRVAEAAAGTGNGQLVIARRGSGAGRYGECRRVASCLVGAESK